MATMIKEREEIKTEKKPVRKDEMGGFPKFWDDKGVGFGFFKQFSEYCDFWRNYHTTTFQVMHMWGDYTMKMWDTFVDQTMHMQNEGRTLFQEWVETYQGICKDYQKMGETNFESMTSVFKK
ncbi:MAG: hypothetical protein L7F78_19280 [Syntrophales bacterium LBB04]|nr:hypothetical protein [Syntrophales bacterium LBB04]